MARACWPAFDACLFCLGVTSVGLAEAACRRVTYDLTLAAARSMVTEHWTGIEPVTTIHGIGALPRTLHLL